MSSPLSSPASRRGFLLVVLAALCWGTSGISGEIVADRAGLGPLDIAWHRMAIGAVVLLGGYALTRRRRTGPALPLPRGTAARLALVGAGLAAYQFAFFAAVATAGVSIATLVALGLAPLLIAVGGALLGHGRPDRATLRRPRRRPGGAGPAGGDLGERRHGDDGGARRPARGRLGARLRGGHPGGGGRARGRPGHARGLRRGRAAAHADRAGRGPAVHDRPGALAVLLYLGAVPSALAYALFFPGLRTVPGAVASIVTLLEPLTATALATAFLGERLEPAALAGGLLVLAAVAGLYVRRLGADRPARTARWTASVDRSSSAPITPRADP